MDYFNYFKRFFGLGNDNTSRNQQFYDRYENNSDRNENNSDRNESYNNRDEDYYNHRFNPFSNQGRTFNPFDGDDDHDNSVFSFNVFTDPLEMQSFFEHKMNELLSQFGMHSPDTFFGNFGFPALGEDDDSNVFSHPNRIPTKPGNLRDRFLKPGYHSTLEGDENHKIDGDLDGKVTSDDINSLLRDKKQPGEEIQPNKVVPYQRRPFNDSVSPHQQRPSVFSFGQSTIQRFIQRPDGTVETHKTVRNQDGTEETTVTQRKGDQEYSVTTRRNKDGQEERTENFVNMDEKDLARFLDGQKFRGGNEPNGYILDGTKTPPPNWFDFDRYFK